MNIFFSFTLFILFFYGLLINYYHRAWNEMESFSAGDLIQPAGLLKVSVIIAARNEEHHILPCLHSLLGQSYPAEKLEIIVVDDHSTDNTAELIRQLKSPQIRLLSLQDELSGERLNSYKKKAIGLAIAACGGALILTTDADCILPVHWVRSMAHFQVIRNAAFIAAPVKICDDGSFLSIFQCLDFIGLQGITGASIYRHFHAMCNGANLGYPKKVFYEVGGFEGIDAIASGDDMLLMHKINVQYPERIFFLKTQGAIVTTAPARDWNAFLQQRIRWASKANKYQDKKLFWVLLLVYLVNVAMLICMLAGFAHLQYLLVAASLIIIKTAFEFFFIRTVSIFFSQRRLIKYFLLMQPFHIIYTVLAGFLGQWGSYRWKGRIVK